MEEKPRNPKEGILNKSLKKWMAAIFFISGLAAFGTFLAFLKIGGDLGKARTIVFALMCVDSLIFAFCVRSFKRSIFRKDIFSNRYLVGAVLIGMALLILAVYFSPLQKILFTQALGLSDWLIILAISFVEIIGIEIFKKRIFRKG